MFPCLVYTCLTILTHCRIRIIALTKLPGLLREGVSPGTSHWCFLMPQFVLPTTHTQVAHAQIKSHHGSGCRHVQHALVPMHARRTSTTLIFMYYNHSRIESLSHCPSEGMIFMMRKSTTSFFNLTEHRSFLTKQNLYN